MREISGVCLEGVAAQPTNLQQSDERDLPSALAVNSSSRKRLRPLTLSAVQAQLAGIEETQRAAHYRQLARFYRENKGQESLVRRSADAPLQEAPGALDDVLLELPAARTGEYKRALSLSRQEVTSSTVNALAEGKPFPDIFDADFVEFSVEVPSAPGRAALPPRPLRLCTSSRPQSRTRSAVPSAWSGRSSSSRALSASTASSSTRAPSRTPTATSIGCASRSATAKSSVSR